MEVQLVFCAIVAVLVGITYAGSYIVVIIIHVITLLRKMYEYPIRYIKGSNFFLLFCLLLGMKKTSKIGSTLKGKNLLLWEQILFFKSSFPFIRKANLKMAEFFP